MNYEGQGPTNIVGSFNISTHEDFDDRLIMLNETFLGNYGLNAVDDIEKICKDDVIYEQYKELLIGDVLNEQFEDRYLSLFPAKLEQYMENSRKELILENYGVGQLSPVVGYTLPIIKKEYIDCISKDLMMTEIPDKPVVKVSFERKFLKDKDGNKYYIPEIFYDDSYKKANELSKGVPIYSEPIAAPLEDYDLMTSSMGAGKVRKGLDKFSYDLHISEVVCDGETIKGLDIRPDVEKQGMFYKELMQNGKKITILGKVNYYEGTVSCSAIGGNLESVKFGGHVSNQYNDNSLDLDRERTPITWAIDEQQRFNTALTIEKIRDMKAMANIDVTPEIVNDMATVMTQFKDSDTLDFLANSLETWRDKKDLPFGYEDGFVESATFDCNVTSGMLTQSDYIEKELKFRFNKLLSSLKTKLKTEELMFVAYAHPNNIELFNASVKWMVDQETKVGGLQLAYKFGVMTETGTRVHFVSSLKVPEKVGIRVVAYPTTANYITFKQYDYSFNIENMYHHPSVPLVPNIMGTHRYKTTELLPIQAEMLLLNNDFGIKSKKVAP